MNGVTTKPASPKQLGWLNNLLNEKDTSAWPPTWLAVADRLRKCFELCIKDGYEADQLNVWLTANGEPLSMADFNSLLDKLKASPKAATVAVHATGAVLKAGNPVTEDGMYRDNSGQFFKVKHNRNGDRMYAERLVVHDEAVKGGHVKISFRYAAGAIMKLTADMKMTYEEAKAFGALYGSCIACGRLLTNELSIAMGIGPICGGHAFGGEWPRLVAEANLKMSGEATCP